MTQLGEGANPPPPPKTPCDHSWVELESKTPADGKSQNAATATKVSVTDPPSAKGYLFENHCIDSNMEKLKIEKVSVKYECVLCKQTQEVDIVGENQIAECKNKKKADLEQAVRLKDIQTKVKGGGVPLAKLNENHPKSGSVGNAYDKAGFAVEMVKGFV